MVTFEDDPHTTTGTLVVKTGMDIRNGNPVFYLITIKSHTEVVDIFCCGLLDRYSFGDESDYPLNLKEVEKPYMPNKFD